MNPLYALGGGLFLGGLWLLRAVLTRAGRTVDRLVAPTAIDHLPPASDQAWVGVAPVPTNTAGEQQ